MIEKPFNYYLRDSKDELGPVGCIEKMPKFIDNCVKMAYFCYLYNLDDIFTNRPALCIIAIDACYDIFIDKKNTMKEESVNRVITLLDGKTLFNSDVLSWDKIPKAKDIRIKQRCEIKIPIVNNLTDFKDFAYFRYYAKYRKDNTFNLENSPMPEIPRDDWPLFINHPVLSSYIQYRIEHE